MRFVFKNFKEKKSRDPHGYFNELFQFVGTEVICAIFKLMKGIKKHQTFPQALQPCNITSIGVC